MGTPLAVTIAHRIQETDEIPEISAQSISAHSYWDGTTKRELLGIDVFPATQLWSDDTGLALIKTKGGDPYMVQTIDLEYLEQNDAWIDTYYNPLCFSCWYWTCQTILTEGDTLGESYSVRLVPEEECEAAFHESDHEDEEGT